MVAPWTAEFPTPYLEIYICMCFLFFLYYPPPDLGRHQPEKNRDLLREITIRRCGREPLEHRFKETSLYAYVTCAENSC